MAEEIDLSELPPRIDDILAGRITGRVVVRIGGKEVLEDSFLLGTG
jgi:hypothetical protein